MNELALPRGGMTVRRPAAPVILVACGLRAEARIARGDPAASRIDTVAGGGDAVALAEALAQGAMRAAGVISFGIAGGLEPGLSAGDVRVADAIVASDGTCHATDAAWTGRIAKALDCPSPVLFANSDVVVTTPAAKAALRDRTGASLVDMESGVAARVASAHGLPFAALRVVTDAADRAMPPAVEVSMAPGGGLNLFAILLSLVKRPGQIPGLIQTGRDSRAAFAALLRCRQRLGPGFALLDLAEAGLDMAREGEFGRPLVGK